MSTLVIHPVNSDHYIHKLKKTVRNEALSNTIASISTLYLVTQLSMLFNYVMSSQIPFIAVMSASIGINIMTCILGYGFLYYSFTALEKYGDLIEFWKTRNIEVLKIADKE